MAQLIRDYWFTAVRPKGLLGLTPEAYRATVAGFATVAAALQAAILLAKFRFGALVRGNADKPARVTQLCMWRTLVLIALSETAVLLGFMLFLVQGQMATVFGFGLVSFLYYAQSYPSARDFPMLV